MGYPKLFFDNRFADAAPVASSTAAGNFNAANIADMRAYTWWQPSALPATITVDSGSAQAADYGLVYAHNLGSKGATIEWRGSNDNFVAEDVLLARRWCQDDRPQLAEFASTSYRYRRLKISGCANLHTNSENTTYAALETSGDALTRDTGAGMSGGMTADKFVAGANGGVATFHRIRPTPLANIVAGKTYCRSWYLRAAGLTKINLLEWCSTSQASITIDLTTQAVVSGTPGGTVPPTGLQYGADVMPSGIVRCWMSFVATVTASYQPMLYLMDPGSSFVGDGVSGVEICGIQFEESPNPSTYLATGAAAVADMPSVAIAMIGVAFVMQKFLSEGFDPMGKKSIQQSNNNENGHPLGKIIDFKQKSQTLQFSSVTWSWLRSQWDPAWDKNISGLPVIIAWDSVNYPQELQLGTASDDYNTPHHQGGTADLSFGFSGVAT